MARETESKAVYLEAVHLLIRILIARETESKAVHLEAVHLLIRILILPRFQESLEQLNH